MSDGGGGGGGKNGSNYPGSRRQHECEDGVLLGSSGLVYISDDGIVVPTVVLQHLLIVYLLSCKETLLK